MQMNKNEYSGLAKVFGFSFMQSIKSKMNIIVTCVLCAIALLSVPVMGLISGHDKEEEDKKSEIENVLVCDETGLSLTDGLKQIKEKKYSSITYKEDSRTIDEVKEMDGENDVYLNISFDAEKGFSLYLIYNTEGKVDKSMAESYVWYIEDNFKEIASSVAGIDNDTLDYLQKEVTTHIHISGEKDDEDSGFMMDNFVFAIVCIITFVFALSGDSIGTSIATEKSTRVMEYLMVTIRPMALITGKILASMLVFIIQIACVGISFSISQLVFGGAATEEIISKYITSNLGSGLSPLNVILAFVIFVEGFLFYGLIAGLSGAAVSRLENINEGMKIYTMLLLIGAYASMFSAMGGKKYMFLYLFPITSPFNATAYLFTGDISAAMALLSIVILAVCILLMLKFVSAVYESMIFYNGNTLGLKQIILLAGKKNSDEKEGEGR